LYGDGQKYIWGVVTPRNLIAAWRATELIRHFDAVGYETLRIVYNAGIRYPGDEEVRSCVDQAKTKISPKLYGDIMAITVPEKVIRAILDNQGDEFAPNLWPITDEVRAGTVEWRQEFADAGVKHPDEVDAEYRAQQKTIAKFEGELLSYAKSRGLDRDCNGMKYVEVAILAIAETGKDRFRSNLITVALAGVLGERSIALFSMSTLRIAPYADKEEHVEKYMDKVREEALANSVNWVINNPDYYNGWTEHLFRRSNLIKNHEEVKEMLTRLLMEHCSLEVKATTAKTLKT